MSKAELISNVICSFIGAMLFSVFWYWWSGIAFFIGWWLGEWLRQSREDG